jgi:hypothetical protein
MCQLTEGEITTTFHLYQPTNGIVFTSEENEKYTSNAQFKLQGYAYVYNFFVAVGCTTMWCAI